MKKKKIIKIVVTVIISLILVLIVSALAVFHFVIKPHTTELTTAIEQIINDPEFVEDIKVDEELSEELIGDELTEYFVEEEQTEQGQEEEKASPPQQPKKPQSEYKSTYDYVKDNVDTKDFRTGVSFASKIDIAYILGLLKGGLTIPEKRELKAYLKKRFTNEEINEGISLYNKYSYLLK